MTQTNCYFAPLTSFRRTNNINTIEGQYQTHDSVWRECSELSRPQARNESTVLSIFYDLDTDSSLLDARHVNSGIWPVETLFSDSLPTVDDEPRCWDHNCNGRLFASRSNLTRHSLEKSVARPEYACVMCGVVFSRKSALRQHVGRKVCTNIRSHSPRRVNRDQGGLQALLGFDAQPNSFMDVGEHL